MSTSTNRLKLQYGLALFIWLTSFFILMKVLGLVHVLELRIFNLFILGATIYAGIKAYRDRFEEGVNYFNSFRFGLAVGGIGILPFALMMLIYLSANPAFMAEVQATEIMGPYLNPVNIGFVLVAEGLGSAFLVTYTVMQYLKSLRPSRIRK